MWLCGLGYDLRVVSKRPSGSRTGLMRDEVTSTRDDRHLVWSIGNSVARNRVVALAHQPEVFIFHLSTDWGAGLGSAGRNSASSESVETRKTEADFVDRLGSS